MATFSGDVQYSQNGTVTNPCLKISKQKIADLPETESNIVQPWPGGDLPIAVQGRKGFRAGNHLSNILSWKFLAAAGRPNGFVWKCRVPLFTQWFCWSLSLLNGYNWGYTSFSDIPKYCMSCGEAWMALQNITWHLAQAHWDALQLPYCFMRQAPMNFCRPPASWPKHFETQLKASTRHNHRPWSIAPNDHITWVREEWTGQILPAWSSFKR